MRVRVDSGLTLDARTTPPRVVERLRQLLSYPNPAYSERRRLGLFPQGEPEKLCFLEEEGGELRLPRGAIHLLRGSAAREGIPLVCEDCRVLPAEKLAVPKALALRDYQARAVDRLTKVTQGTVVIPCGGGKTRVGMGAIARLRTPTLVLVHTVDLAKQWEEEVREKLGIPVGLVGDGEARIEQVTVAVLQSLVRWKKERLEAFLRSFGFLILDEAHHVAASTFHSVVTRCPARFRIGLTATPEREDGLTVLLELFLGARLLEVTHEELVAAGVLALPAIHGVETNFTYPYAGTEDYLAMLAALAKDEVRNRLILDTVAREAREENVCLVLSSRIEHCEALAKSLVAQGVSAEALSGKVRREKRRALLHQVREGKLSVLVATSLADEGLDLPRLSRVFLAFPSRARGRTAQRLGRLMRPHPDKKDAALFDFVDMKVPLLRRQYLERRKLYAEVLGCPASRVGKPRVARGLTT